MSENRRVQYSKNALKEALIELLEEKKISAITVTELCKRADVNRGTFYAYYETPYQLLDSIEEELFESVMGSLVKYAPEKDVRNLLLDVFSVIEDNRELCTIILADSKEHTILNRLLYSINENSMQSWMLEDNHESKKELDYMFSFMVEGTIGIVKRWLAAGSADSKEYIVDIVMKNLGIVNKSIR